MDKLILTGTQDTPNVILDKDENKFQFSGKSLPEDVKEFYSPIIQWIEEYAKTPNAQTTIEFKMEYFNTASSKIILDILTRLETMVKNGTNVEVHWYYQTDDEDMQEAGEAYADIIEVPIKLIGY